MKEWNNDLLLGVSFIDSSHKETFDMFDKILNQKDSLENRLISLLIHLKYSFSDEESLLMDINIPEYSYHKEEHNYFIQEVENLVIKIIKNNDIIAEEKKINSLIDAFSDHILQKDSQIKNYFFYP